MLVTRPARLLSNQRSRLTALLIAIILSAGLAGRPAQADTPPPKEIDARYVIEQFGNALAEGRRETRSHLSRLGFATEVEDLRKPNATQLQAFSSRTMIESLYRRGEAHKAGEGDRFLAVLYHDAAKRSAALAQDPDFAGLRKFSADELDIKKRPFTFAGGQAISDVGTRRALPPAADKVIGKLTDHYSGRGLGQARVVVLRSFRKQGFDGRAFERALAETSTTEDALRRLVELGTPPPRPETALRDVLREAMAGSAALSVDRGALEIMEELSRELPPELERYAQTERRLGSRKLQMAEAAEIHQPGKARPKEIGDVIGRVGNDPPDVPGRAEPGPGSGPNPGPGPAPGGKPHPSNGGAPQPSDWRGTGNQESGRFARNYGTYTGQTFEPLHNGPARSPTASPTPRSYRVAIRSARAARGIAIGGNVSGKIDDAPVRAVWLPNRTDDRFGRLFVQFPVAPGRPPVVGASRVMFADSFYAAASVLWGKHDAEATFREGEILVLMSMDPGSTVSRSALEAAMQKRRALQKAVWDKLDPAAQGEIGQKLAQMKGLESKAKGGDSAALASLLTLERDVEARLELAYQKLDPAMRKKAEAEIQRLAATRGIVTHPAIVGRELSWSAARVDFWFNQMDRLSAEATTMNGGRAMPANLRNLSLAGASTWQFFEQDSVVQFGASEGRARRLVVTSVRKDDAASPQPGSHARSHFGISMFGQKGPAEAKQVEDGLYRLESLESELQPLLDWLAVNHHDFMRLNDFSEALSLLRWIRSNQTEVTVIDMDGQGEPIATPDRVEIGRGPRVSRD